MCAESGAILIGDSHSGLIGLIFGFVFSVAFFALMPTLSTRVEKGTSVKEHPKKFSL